MKNDLSEGRAFRPTMPNLGNNERLVYLMPQDAFAAAQQDEIDLFKLWETLWQSRLLIAGITAAFALASVMYALLMPPWYKASVLLAPIEEKSPLDLIGQFGGLASLAGIDTGTGGSVEAVAVLKSRDFSRSFIEDHALLHVLYADEWNAAANRWKQMPPDLRDAVKYFEKHIREVKEDRKSGLVTLTIEWKDPELAASWANLLAMRLNDHMRKRALAEAEANVEYLRGELDSTSVVTLQQSIGRLLENEMQKLMLARGNSQFAFHIIDRAEVPKQRSKPRRAFVISLGVLLGGVFSVFVVLFRDAIRNRAMAVSGASGYSPPAPVSQD